MYFDSAATTPLDPRVKEEMIQHMDVFGNENSKHCYGFESLKKIDESLLKIAQILKVSSDQIFVTYSGTDSNRKVVKAVEKRIDPKNCFCSAVEHSSLIDEFPESQYFDPRGSDMDLLKIKNPKFLALMGANSETGALYELNIFRQNFPEALILRDFSQSFAKGIFPGLKNCDFGTFAPQKIYGPKMIGLLYVKNPENFPEISKDSHTKNVFLTAGMAKAFEIWETEHLQNKAQLKKWQYQIENYFTENIPDIKIHEKEHARIDGLMSIAFRGVRGSEMMTLLSMDEGLAISTGSACNSDILSPTQVIQHIEKDSQWQFPIRIGLHKFLTDEMVTDFCEIIEQTVKDIRARNF